MVKHGRSCKCERCAAERRDYMRSYRQRKRGLQLVVTAGDEPVAAGAVETAVRRELDALSGSVSRPGLCAAVERPTVQEEDFDQYPWCGKRHMRHLMPVKQVRQQLGGISPTTFYALVKEGELSLVKIGRRSFVHAEDLDEFLLRKRYDPPGRTEAALTSSRPTSWQPVTPRGRQD
jgi:excisionase family DNA binding protein